MDPFQPGDYAPVRKASSEDEEQPATSTQALSKPVIEATGINITAAVPQDNLREVLIAGLSFGLVFTGFFMITSYQTSVNANLGTISLAVSVSCSICSIPLCNFIDRFCMEASP